MKLELDLDVEQVARRAADLVLEQLASSEPADDGLRLLSAGEVGALMGRSERWVRERKRRGDLPHVRLDGGAPMYRRCDIEAFIQARRIGR